MSQVIINDIPPYTQGMASGGQTVFGTNWTANVASDVKVYLTPVGNQPDDATQLLQFPADYSVAFVGALQEVQVTLSNPATLGDIVTITRLTPADRENLYSNTNFTPSMLNNDFGILTLVDQQAELVNQMIAPRYNYSAQINPAPFSTRDTILPLLGPNETWAMNASHTAIEAVAFSTGTGTITEIDTGLGLTGGPITSSGTISFAAMTPNTFWGNITGGTALPTMVSTGYFLKTANNLNDLTNVLQAQINLGLEIGVDVQAYSALLTSFAALPGTAKTIPYFSATNTFALIGPAASSVLITNASSVPSLSNTLPFPVQTNITELGVQAQDLDMGNHQIHNVVDPTNPQDAATKAYVTAKTTGTFLPLAGGTMTGAINMGNKQINALADPTSSQDAVTLSYLTGPNGLAGYLPLSGGTMTGQINMGSHKIISLLDPTNPQDAATKNYVDTVAIGFNIQPAVYAATTANLAGYTYANGAAGIGATLTAGSTGVFTTDGTTPPVNSRILVPFQTSTFQNGIYVLTTSSGGSNAVLTRATDYDQPSEVQPGDFVIVQNGTLYGTTSWIETASVSVIGTDPILFTQFTSAPGAFLLKANNLSDVANTVTSFNNISPSTTKGDLIVNDGTNDVRLPVGGTDGQILQVKAAASTGIAWSTATYPVTTTANQILFSSATNVISGISTTIGGVLVTDASSVPQFLANPGVSGKILQSVNGAIPAYSVPTYPSASGAAGKIIISDGTNNVYSTPTYPNTATAGHILFGDGTNIVLSTPTYPNASVTARKIIVSDGTNFIASAETWAVPGTTGNVLTSDGTNWTSAPATGTGTVNAGTTNQVAYYATSGTAVSGATLGQGLAISAASLIVGAANNIPFNTGKGIIDSNAQNLLTFTTTASAVNYLNITNNVTGSAPIFSAVGSDSNIGINFQAKGTGNMIFSSSLGNILTLAAVASAVNSFSMTASATGSGPQLVASGSDSNVSMNIGTKGTGSIVFLSNATVTPDNLFTLTPSSTPVNYLTTGSSNTGVAIPITATGSDANISIVLDSKGTGGIQLKGVSDASNASAGYVEEFISSSVTQASPVGSMTSTTPKNVTSINLSAGDWEVFGNVGTNNSSVGMSFAGGWISTTSATRPDLSLMSYMQMAATAAISYWINTVPTVRINVSAGSTTVYLSAVAQYASGTQVCYGNIYARRRR
jgi:hypothetical protein